MKIFKSFYFVTFLCSFISQANFGAEGILKSLKASPSVWSIDNMYNTFKNTPKEYIQYSDYKRYSEGKMYRNLPGKSVAENWHVGDWYSSFMLNYHQKYEQNELFNDTLLHSITDDRRINSNDNYTNPLKSVLHSGLKYGFPIASPKEAICFNDPSQSTYNPKDFYNYYKNLFFLHTLFTTHYASFASYNSIYSEKTFFEKLFSTLKGRNKDYKVAEYAKGRFFKNLQLSNLRNNYGGGIHHKRFSNVSPVTLMFKKNIITPSPGIIHNLHPFYDDYWYYYNVGEKRRHIEHDKEKFFPVNNYLKGLMLNHNFSLGKIAQIYDTVMQQPFYADKVKRGDIKFYSIYGNELSPEIMNKIVTVAKKKDWDNKEKW